MATTLNKTYDDFGDDNDDDDGGDDDILQAATSFCAFFIANETKL